MKIPPLRYDLRIALIYLVIGGIWILLSDRLLAALISDPALLTAYQTRKGWVFVLCSAILIFFLLYFDRRLRKKTEGMLREGEERYRLIFEKSIDAILLTTPDGSILAANPAACRMLGRYEAEIIQLGRVGVVDPTDPRLQLALEARSRTGRFSGELRMLRRDGTPFETEVSNTLFTDASGRSVTSMIIRDISERKRTENELRRINRALATLSKCNEVLVRAQHEGDLLNQICLALVQTGGYLNAWVGYAEHDEGKSVRPVAQQGLEDDFLDTLKITWADEERGRGPTGLAIRTGVIQIGRDFPDDPNFAPWRLAAAEHGFVSSIALPLISEGETLGALNMYSTDSDSFDTTEVALLSELASDLAYGITTLRMRIEHARVLEEIISNEERLKIVVKVTNSAIWDWDLITNGLWWGEGFETKFGFQPDEVGPTSESWLKHIHSEDRDRVIQSFTAVINTDGQFWTEEYRYERFDGSFAHVQDRAYVIRDPDGKAIRMIGGMQDISAFRHAEKEIRMLNAQLEKRVADRTSRLEAANRELETFSYSVSHDLRAPLRAIHGFSSIVLAQNHRENLNDEGRHYVENIIQAAERMGRLIDDLLSYSLLGRSGMHHEQVPLTDLFADLTQDLKDHLEKIGGVVEIAYDMPVINSDRTLLSQIFTNLLENAITYQKPDNPPHVAATFHYEGDHIVICIRDNGIGVSPEFQEKIFNVFQRLHSEEKYPGTGIGLATVKKAAELLGGSVWVESVPDQGSSFFVRLPGVQS